eukprot:1192307-Prorocentrum_minimum.AAC.1
MIFIDNQSEARRFQRREGDPGRGGLQGARPRAGFIGNQSEARSAQKRPIAAGRSAYLPQGGHAVRLDFREVDLPLQIIGIAQEWVDSILR